MSKTTTDAAKVPQIWEEYCASDASSEQIILRRIGSINKAIDEKKAAVTASRKATAAAKKAREQFQGAPLPPTRKSNRKRVKTVRSQFIDTDSDTTYTDAGATEEFQGSDNEFELSLPPTKRQRRNDDDNDHEDEEPAFNNMHPRDPSNFFKLSAALKLLLAHKITDASIDKADVLLREYSTELIELYGPSVVKPNHHYATHVAASARDFGPLHVFWTFLFERINKVLKSYNSSNHSGGELETSFFREFHRTILQSRLMNLSRSHAVPGSPLSQSLDVMYRTTADDRGTVQTLAKDLNSIDEDGGIKFQLSSRYLTREIPYETYARLLRHFQFQFPMLSLRSHLTPASGIAATIALCTTFTIFDYVIIAHRRYLASSRCNSPENSLIAVSVGGHRQVAVAELVNIFVFEQEQLGRHILGHVRWLPQASMPANRAFWNTADSDSEDFTLPTFIQLSDIISHVVKISVNNTEQSLWATIQLNPSH
ncbi:hypothetical protein H0H93_015717 [Arthromyces matolae]|nr:hypothetical protein H0H93_015717 [Arthromyces matolae]